MKGGIKMKVFLNFINKNLQTKKNDPSFFFCKKFPENQKSLTEKKKGVIMGGVYFYRYPNLWIANMVIRNSINDVLDKEALIDAIELFKVLSYQNTMEIDIHIHPEISDMIVSILEEYGLKIHRSL